MPRVGGVVVWSPAFGYAAGRSKRLKAELQTIFPNAL